VGGLLGVREKKQVWGGRGAGVRDLTMRCYYISRGPRTQSILPLWRKNITDFREGTPCHPSDKWGNFKEVELSAGPQPPSRSLSSKP